MLAYPQPKGWGTIGISIPMYKKVKDFLCITARYFSWKVLGIEKFTINGGVLNPRKILGEFFNNEVFPIFIATDKDN